MAAEIGVSTHANKVNLTSSASPLARIISNATLSSMVVSACCTCSNYFQLKTIQVLNFCANNYLGLSAHPEVIQASKDALDNYGAGLSSVRFICGTQVQLYIT